MTGIERTAGELLAAQAQGESAESITNSFLQAIRERDPMVAAFLLVDETAALEQARIVDRKRKNGGKLGPLAGIPVALKDVLCVKGQRTTCGSKILRDFKPSESPAQRSIEDTCPA